jgi:hypothetical protein
MTIDGIGLFRFPIAPRARLVRCAKRVKTGDAIHGRQFCIEEEL